MSKKEEIKKTNTEETVKVNTQETTENKAEKVEAQESAEETPTILKSEYDKVCALADDYKNKWYSVSAEYDNFRKRNAQVSSTRYNEGRCDVISKFFPLADNLDRALVTCENEKTRQGIEMVIRAFSKILSEEGVQEINPVGEEFDAKTMEAIMAVPAEEGEESGIVKTVFAKGYKKGDKIIKYAQVVVTQ